MHFIAFQYNLIYFSRNYFENDVIDLHTSKVFIMILMNLRHECRNLTYNYHLLPFIKFLSFFNFSKLFYFHRKILLESKLNKIKVRYAAGVNKYFS